MKSLFVKAGDRKSSGSSTAGLFAALALAFALSGFAAWKLVAAEYEFGSVASVQTLVRPGDPSPLGGGLSSVERPILLSSSTLAFLGSNEGVFVHGPQGLTEIAVSGDLSPGGEIFTSLGWPFMSSDPSWVVSQAEVGDQNDGIFLWDGNSVVAVAVEGDGTWIKINGSPAVNSLGQVAFIDYLSLILWDGSYTTVARTTDPNPCGGTFNRIPQGSSGGCPC